MKRIISTFLLFTLFVSGMQAQEKLHPLKVNPVLNAHRLAGKSAVSPYFSNPYSYYSKRDTLQDNFSATGPYPDSSKWIDNTVFVNTDFPISPINIGVATFDGLDKNGYPYDFTAGGLTSVSCDTLTSKRIRMTGSPTDSSYYLSFYYEAQGRGSAPEPSDSLFLEFRSSHDSITWREAWAEAGYAPTAPDTGFHRVMVPLYRHDSVLYQYASATWFQFRFRNYSNPAGNVNHWHLDCVDLRPGRSPKDTVIAQVSFVYQPLSFLANYQSMPWKQYQGVSDMATNTHIYIRNNDINPRNMTYQYQGEHYGAPFSTSWSAVDPGLNPFLTNGYSAYPNCANPPVSANGFSFGNSLSDTTVFSINHIIYENILNKDTIVSTQRFFNYYAYDDGTAELGYGLEGAGTNAGAQLAVRFSTNIADTLRAVQFFWNPVQLNVSLDAFRLCVWAPGTNNQPGTMIYRSDSSFTPQYLPGYDHFRTYKLDYLLPISGVFYVGWEQYTQDNLSVGFDQNTDASSNNFYKIDSLSPWSPSVYPGSLMIRPLFGDTIKVTGIQEHLTPLSFVSLYPNPAQDKLTVSIPSSDDELYKIELFNMLGSLVAESVLSKTEPLDVSFLGNGFYLVRISGKNKISCTKKLLIAR